MKLPKIIREPSSHGDRSSAVLIKTLGREVTVPPPVIVLPISCIGATPYLSLTLDSSSFTVKIIVDGVDHGYHDINGWNKIRFGDNLYLDVYLDSNNTCNLTCYKRREDNTPMRFEFLPNEDMREANITGILDTNPTAVYNPVNRSVKVCFTAEAEPQ